MLSMLGKMLGRLHIESFSFFFFSENVCLPCKLSLYLTNSLLLSVDVSAVCLIIGKLCKPWSDATFCGIWSWSTLFAQAFQSVQILRINVVFMSPHKLFAVSGWGQVGRASEFWGDVHPSLCYLLVSASYLAKLFIRMQWLPCGCI